ncbi:hypothetical protein A5674_27510 [Mycobacterium malmoense]|nr:hypothetical protein A5674_27510 [Mycobacterium malmoense]
MEEPVNWSTLGGVCIKVSSGATPLTGRADYYEGGDVPWLRTAEVVWRDVYETEVKITEKAVRETGAKWIPADCVIVAISGATAARAAINKIPLTTNQHCCNLEIDPKQANYRYVFHWVTANYEKLKAFGRGARSDLNARLIKNFPIPLPSLQKQREIVRVLDSFGSLQAELKAELQARKSQYAFYRESLLTHGDDISKVALGDVLSMRAGKFIAASEISPIQTDKNLYPCYGGNGIRGYVAVPNHEGRYVLVGRQGAWSGNVRRVDGQFYATEHAVVVTVGEDVDVDWAFHMLTVMDLNQYVSRGAQPGLAVGTLNALEIPLPPLDAQKRAAGILDKFDLLVNDSSVGIPAELNARHKQYEYYRDRLLTFEELAG